LGDVYANLGSALAIAATSNALRPWEITLPATDSGIWEAVRPHLVSALKARGPVATDSVKSVLVLDNVRISGDTLFARIIVGVEWRCAGKWTGNSTSHELIGIWHGTAWEYPMKEVGRGYGDGAPCYKR